MFRFIVLVILISIVFAIVRRFFNSLLSAGSANHRTRGHRQPKRSALRGEMFKDPQCGMYVAKDLALTARSGKETFYFCSEECRDRFLSVDR